MKRLHNAETKNKEIAHKRARVSPRLVTDLSHEIIGHIISFVTDARSLLRASASCRAFHIAVVDENIDPICGALDIDRDICKWLWSADGVCGAK
jgi:hypothetical protein